MSNKMADSTIYYSDPDVNLGMHPVTKDVIRKTNVAAVRQALRLLLLTRFYEKKWQPEFGTPLRDLLFGQLDDFTLFSMQEQLRRAIETWEPRVVVEELTCKANRESEFSVEVTLIYTIVALGVRDTFQYTINRIR